VNNVERLREAALHWRCPAGSYPCNGTSAGSLCVERHRWCDDVVDCPNEEDEDPEHCRQYSAPSIRAIVNCGPEKKRAVLFFITSTCQYQCLAYHSESVRPTKICPRRHANVYRQTDRQTDRHHMHHHHHHHQIARRQQRSVASTQSGHDDEPWTTRHEC